MNEPQSLHELHQEDAEEERKRIAKFDQMAGEASRQCSHIAWLASVEIEEAQESEAFFEQEILSITHALWSAIRRNGNLHLLTNRQILESLEEVMLVAQERIDEAASADDL